MIRGLPGRYATPKLHFFTPLESTLSGRHGRACFAGVSTADGTRALLPSHPARAEVSSSGGAAAAHIGGKV